MAEVRINQKDWARVDGDGLTLRISDTKDAENMANIIGDEGTSKNDAGWIDIAQAIFEAVDDYNKEIEAIGFA